MFEALVALAWCQHGAFSTAQAEAQGVSRTTLGRHRQKGTIIRRVPGVYVLAAAPQTSRQELVVHVLAAGPSAKATGDSALGLWCPELALPRRPVVAVPASCGYRPRGAEIIRSSDLSLAKPAVVDGIPTVGVARALLDASRTSTVDQIVARIGACQRHLPMSFGALVEALQVHARPGRNGVATFRSALRTLSAEVPDSEFERLVIRDLVAAGVPEPRLHHLVTLDATGPTELDLDWPGRLLDVELDGRDHIARMATAQRDRARDRALQRAGYFVARFVWADYLEGRDAMIAEIADLVDCRATQSACGVTLA